MTGATEARIDAMSEQIEGVRREVAELRGYHEAIISLKMMVSEIIRRLDSLTGEGTVRCSERGQIISHLIERVGKLESGDTPQTVELKSRIKNLEDDTIDHGSRLTALEKRILFWAGGCAVISTFIPYVIQYFMK